ncbi:MAG: YIP1 family protein [Bacteroidales bacterium]|jgi:hypothetical protein|nr:YIP1 family protein [Bacteroidales bacterium]
MDVFYHIRNLLIQPSVQWAAIASENKSIKRVFCGFVFPLLLLIAVCVLLGSVLFASRIDFSAVSVVKRMLLLFASLSAGLYLSAFLINTTMIHLCQRNIQGVFALMAYSSSVAMLLIAMVELLPFPYLKELLVLMFYSVFLYWRGIPAILDIPAGKRGAFIVLSVVTSAAGYALPFFLFSKILNAI